MSAHLREISENSVASHDTELSEDARLARATEEMLAVTDAATQDQDILRRTLSVHSVISSSLSFAERMQRAKWFQSAALVVIGRGTCGTVFEIPGTKSAYKKGSDKHSLWNDANLTNIACRAVTETKTSLQEIFPNVSIPRVPEVTGWISQNDLENWWLQNLSRFPDDTQTGYIFQVQRILPLPKPSREALIRLYFPKKLRRSAYQDPDNKACLVRPYLGQRRGEWEFSSPVLSLQNFPLYLDQIEELQLEATQFSEEMAVGLAIIHWRAFLDGMDMEFVLGSATADGELPTVVENFKTVKPFETPAGDFKRRQVHLWMLDFDKADQLNLKESWKSCCDKMVTAVTANDPYFPNPAATGTLEHKLWDTFEHAYLLAASNLLHIQRGLPKKANKYPALFLKAWEKKATELAKDTEGNFVEFG
ncbi:hypothetical protein DTO013E5_6580 [Penicillium roqueforti]|uniref:uncharacterized protein n=1 Tax=Penicillium roqueforti TaxID=5082 RepID=UPI00190C9DA3|nr:uncharacterized protein LCP9604111_6756 [Penicillium roqueforti]KAF9246084.1 hypothetical protein LCP9604111_6756 [Penicillium roqueforti]KAI1834440.1 hypothetical protein CBS147337_4730 [Penicillium roqueforti]KAI2686034.1 hypothetical protein CBS147355_1521 [Penicillium roqueforti]KAI2692251.1 hypothetical protein LCP963914a_345 [Penicillium roqueforti]KAI2717847.1 hypothetical protein CBS147318_4424 [Penicillium roqueforti]